MGESDAEAPQRWLPQSPAAAVYSRAAAERAGMWTCRCPGPVTTSLCSRARSSGALKRTASMPRQRAARMPMRPAHQAHVGAAGDPGERLAERHGEARISPVESRRRQGVEQRSEVLGRRRRLRRL